MTEAPKSTLAPTSPRAPDAPLLKERAKAKLAALRRSNHPRNKQWRNAGYFDVPGSVMRELAAAGLCETRKRDPAAPQEYRP